VRKIEVSPSISRKDDTRIRGRSPLLQQEAQGGRAGFGRVESPDVG
jgi:hypothetical protein